jgi:hypothetical protein
MSAHPVGLRMGALFVVLFTLLSSGLTLERAIASRPVASADDEEIRRYEARFRQLRSALPSRGVVGYVADPKGPERPFDARYARRFYLTQYVLAPVVVVDSVAPALAVGNFHSAWSDRDARKAGLVLDREFGDGVLLFRRESP